MPPHVIDVRSAEDTRDVVHHAVQALAEGKVVAFPTETVYVLAASAFNESAVESLADITQRAAATRGQRRTPMALAVKSADEALDYVPDMCLMGQRLGRRCWPGPLTLVVEDHHPDSLLRQLSPGVQKSIAPDGLVGLGVPAHAAIQDVLRLLAGPVVIANAPRKDSADAVTAQEVIDAGEQHVKLVLDDGRSRFGQPSSIVRVDDNRYEMLRVGVVSPQALKRLASTIVLFVCTGNTCRSPMAEGMFRKAAADRLGCRPDEVDDHGLIVISAGLAAMSGGRASPEAVIVLRDMGVDLSAHESQPLTEALVRHADLVLAMTRSHRQAILAEWPEVAGRTKLLSHSGADIADPVGGPAELYRRCATQIRSELDEWLDGLDIGPSKSGPSKSGPSKSGPSKSQSSGRT